MKTIETNSIVKIGNVSLDISGWLGHDDYSDGPIEEELYKRLLHGEQPVDILMNDDRYPILYHLSRERENILSWYPFTGKERILEVGAGCGAITGVLCQSGKEVVSVELSLQRAKINALRHASEKNLTIQVQNIMMMEETGDYDIVTLIGVLEYANLFTATDNSFIDLLKHMKGMLKENGHLLIAIENRFGLKYLLGAREDHHWTLNEGLYGYPNRGAETFSAEELLNLVSCAGFKQAVLYSAWPDYKFPSQMKRMDSMGDPLYRDDATNFGEYIIQNASPRRVMNEMLCAGLGNNLANSFFLDASDLIEEMPSDVLMNTNRNERFACASIIYPRSGVEKVAIGKSEATSMIWEGAQLLAKRLGSSNVLCPRRKNKTTLAIDWVRGETLYHYMKEHPDELSGLLERYLHQFDQLIIADKAHLKGNGLFSDFQYGDEILVCPAPIDLNFSNIMVCEDEWTVFDTEWVLNETVPLRYILWRSIFLYEEKDGKTNETLRACLNASETELELFQQMERKFNEYAYGASSPYQYVRRYVTEAKTLEKVALQVEADQKKIKQLQSENQLQTAQLNACKKEIDTAWTQFSDREKQLHETRKKLMEMEMKLQSTEKKLVEAEDNISKKTMELLNTENKLSEAEDYISKINQLWDIRIRKKMKRIPEIPILERN